MFTSLPAEYLDPGTPPEVVVTDQLNPPVTDSTLRAPLGAPGSGLPAMPDMLRPTLVTIGDSLTHGMFSGAMFTPACHGPPWSRDPREHFSSSPLTGDPLDGLPLNLEKLLRGLQGTSSKPERVNEHIAVASAAKAA
jgi:hypothetical protein